jgi:hypothetical protein
VLGREIPHDQLMTLWGYMSAKSDARLSLGRSRPAIGEAATGAC